MTNTNDDVERDAEHFLWQNNENDYEHDDLCDETKLLFWDLCYGVKHKHNCYRFASPADPYQMFRDSMEVHWI